MDLGRNTFGELPCCINGARFVHGTKSLFVQMGICISENSPKFSLVELEDCWIAQMRKYASPQIYIRTNAEAFT